MKLGETDKELMNENIQTTPAWGSGEHPSQKSGAEGTVDRAKDAVRESKENLKTKTADLKAKAVEMGAQAKDKAEEFAAGKKAGAADRIEGYSEKVREVSDRLNREQDPNIAHYTRLMADKLEQAAGYVRNTDYRELRRDAESLARRNPAVFFGGMFLAGLVAARFLKASSEHTHETDTDYEDYTPASSAWENEGGVSAPTYPSYPSPAI